MRKIFLNIFFLTLLSGSLMAQKTMIKGLVQDENTKEPLIGATIITVNSDKGVLTDIDGNFSKHFSVKYEMNF